MPDTLVVVAVVVVVLARIASAINHLSMVRWQVIQALPLLLADKDIIILMGPVRDTIIYSW